MKKVDLTTEMIQKRIAHADYVAAGIPGERQLAEELGLSRITIRTAIQKLIEQGTLVRLDNGRLAVASPQKGTRKLTIGFVVPGSDPVHLEQWWDGVEAVLKGQPVTLRPVIYGHWADPSVQEVLSSFDGAFFTPPTEPIPPWMITKMKESTCRIVVLNQDESKVGLPSLTMFSHSLEIQLFDYLYKLGHRGIDCLNTQGINLVIESRIYTWRKYLATHQLAGKVFSLVKHSPAPSGYEIVSNLLKKGHRFQSSLFCTTTPAALGAMRAFHDAGITVGRDISLCAVDGEGIAQFFRPSLTTLEPPSVIAYLEQIREWMLGNEQWHGPLLIQPRDVSLSIGESTGPAL